PCCCAENAVAWPLAERRVRLVETVGNAPTATILQGSSAPLCCPYGGPEENQASVFRCEATSPRLVGRDGVEPPQTMRGVYSALGSPMPSLPVIGCRGLNRTGFLQLMRLASDRCSSLR